MIRLRYHHLMCLPRFQNSGYSDEFCANMQRVKTRFDSEKYQLVEGCDDICKACPNSINGVCIDEEKVSRYDSLVKQAIENSEPYSPSNICSDCRWFYICKNID